MEITTNFILEAMNQEYFKNEAKAFLEKDFSQLQPEKMKTALYDNMAEEVKLFSGYSARAAWDSANRKFKNGLETFVGKCFFAAIRQADIDMSLSTIIFDVDYVVDLLEKAKSETAAWSKERRSTECFEEVFESKFISILTEALKEYKKQSSNLNVAENSEDTHTD